MAYTRGRALCAKEKKPWRTDGGYSIARGSSGLAAHTASFGLKTPPPACKEVRLGAVRHPIIVACDMGERVGTRREG
jgi:hypothetical protein